MFLLLCSSCVGFLPMHHFHPCGNERWQWHWLSLKRSMFQCSHCTRCGLTLSVSPHLSFRKESGRWSIRARRHLPRFLALRRTGARTMMGCLGAFATPWMNHDGFSAIWKNKICQQYQSSIWAHVRGNLWRLKSGCVNFCDRISLLHLHP